MARKKPGPSVGYDPQTGLIPRGVVLVQPCATLAVSGRMPVVRMAWGTSYRGRVYIVSGMLWGDINRAVCNSRPYVDALRSLGYNRNNPLPLHALVGHVDLVEIENYVECEDQHSIPGLRDDTYHGCGFRNRYDWIIDNPHTCKPVESADGYPCLFRVGIESVNACVATARPAGPGAALIPTAMDGTILEVGWQVLKSRITA